MVILAEILSSRVRAEIFRLLFGVDPMELHMREMTRRAGFTIGTIQTELKKLSRLGLVTSRRDGNRLYYKAQQAHPLYPDIRNLVLKTAGLADVLRQALAPSNQIRIAFVFGSLARQEDTAGSDVDVMIIGKLGLRDVTRLLAMAEVADRISREINPYVLTSEEFNNRRSAGDHFVTQLIDSPKIFIVGSQDELETMG